MKWVRQANFVQVGEYMFSCLKTVWVEKFLTTTVATDATANIGRSLSKNPIANCTSKTKCNRILNNFRSFTSDYTNTDLEHSVH